VLGVDASARALANEAASYPPEDAQGVHGGLAIGGRTHEPPRDSHPKVTGRASQSGDVNHDVVMVWLPNHAGEPIGE